jgi:hypothetical protein
MNPGKLSSVIYIFMLFICSNAIQSKQGEVQNVQIEFENHSIENGILNKFDDFFEDSQYTEELDNYDELFNEDDQLGDVHEQEEYNEEQELMSDYYYNSDSQSDSDEYIDYKYDPEDGTEEINHMMTNQLNKTEEDGLTDVYRNFVYKLCLLTALSKETRIYATENLRV